MDAQEIKTASKEWYTLGRTFLPSLDSQAFATVAGKSHAFVYDIAGGEKSISLRVDRKIDTAAADLHKREILVSANYFDRQLYVNRFGEIAEEDTEELAIALINGSVIHEALHFKYTAMHGAVSLSKAIEDSKKGRRAAAKYGMNIAATAFNIIEDIYIEHNCPNNLQSWLQACSDTLFSEEDLERDWDMKDIGDFLNLAIAFKNKENRDHEAFSNFTEEQLSYLKQAASKFYRYANGHLIWRVDLAMDFLNTFELDESESESEGEGEGESGDEGESKSEDESESGDEGKGELEGMGEDGEKDESESESEETPTSHADEGKGAKFAEALGEAEGLDEDEIGAIEREVEEASEKVTEDELDYETSEDGGITWKRLVEKDILEMGKDTFLAINPKTEIDFAFLRDLQAIRTANRTPGAARKSGSVMVKSRLTRIATDGKIFAKNDANRNTLKRIEVIINVDFSGSTAGSVIDNELGAATAMSKILRAAGIAHSVYGHTSTSGNKPLLFHIFSHDMKVTNHDFEKRFEAARYVSLSQNFDGVIIRELGDKFTGRDASKFLINLSDGEPAAPGYNGHSAENHTKQEIENLREKRIGVFAISVVGGVVWPNDRIYGKDFNIDGSRDTNAQFRKLITKIAQG